MRRREFTWSLLAASIWPLAARARERGNAVIGYLGPTTAENDKERIAVFLRRLGTLGWREGQNLEVRYRWAEGHPDAAERIATEFVRLRPDLIVTYGTAAVMAAKRATAEIPIVFGAVGDPVGNGLVATLARPGGNATGLSTLQTETGGKRFELLRQLIPDLKRIAILAHVGSAGALRELHEVEATARTLGIASQSVEIRSVDEFAPAFEELKGRVEIVHLCADPLVTTNRSRIADLALKTGLPTIYNFGEYVQAGGLMSYGPSIAELFERLADYVDKVLRGANPSELPVEQPARFFLVINRKTAKALGIVVPATLLALADEVIE